MWCMMSRIMKDETIISSFNYTYLTFYLWLPTELGAKSPDVSSHKQGKLRRRRL